MNTDLIDIKDFLLHSCQHLPPSSSNFLRVHKNIFYYYEVKLFDRKYLYLWYSLDLSQAILRKQIVPSNRDYFLLKYNQYSMVILSSE